MTEERLKEIKKCIDLQKEYPILHDDGHLIEQKLELYNEVVRLGEIIDKATDKLYCWGEALNTDFQKGMLDILNKSNLTLEQLNGVENE